MREFARNVFRHLFGLEVFRVGNLPAYAKQQESIELVLSMQKFGIDMVFDIGANTGRFASEIRQYGYAGRIVSFEPLSDAHDKLRQSSMSDPLWDVYPRCALGDHDGEVEINIAGNSESSSLLPMLQSHISAAPQSSYKGREPVSVRTLDSVSAKYIEQARPIFLKIDTQGYEWQVLDGAVQTLPHIKGILVELTLTPLYGGQHLWQEIIERLEAEGFTLWAIRPVFSDKSIGRTLQVDGVFFRDT